MTGPRISIALDEADFRALTSGGVVRKTGANGSEVVIILSDIGLDRLFMGLADAVRATRDASYRDDSCPERECDHCGKLYRGPANYCRYQCAIDDI